jgi:hypothetical protein
MNQPMRVSTYGTGNTLPEAVQKSLSSVEQLQLKSELVAEEFADKANSDK